MNLDDAEIDRKLTILHQQYITQEQNKLSFMVSSHEREILMLWGVFAVLLVGITIDNVRIHRELERLRNGKE